LAPVTASSIVEHRPVVFRGQILELSKEILCGILKSHVTMSPKLVYDSDEVLRFFPFARIRSS